MVVSSLADRTCEAKTAMTTNCKVALVTGAGSGIGRAVALTLTSARGIPWCWQGVAVPHLRAPPQWQRRAEATLSRSHQRRKTDIGTGTVRPDQGSFWPVGCSLKQCRDQRTPYADGRPDLRTMDRCRGCQHHSCPGERTGDQGTSTQSDDTAH